MKDIGRGKSACEAEIEIANRAFYVHATFVLLNPRLALRALRPRVEDLPVNICLSLLTAPSFVVILSALEAHLSFASCTGSYAAFNLCRFNNGITTGLRTKPPSLIVPEYSHVVFVKKVLAVLLLRYKRPEFFVSKFPFACELRAYHGKSASVSIASEGAPQVRLEALGAVNVRALLKLDKRALLLGQPAYEAFLF